MTWAPTETQKAIYTLLNTDVALATLMGKYTAPVPPAEGSITNFVFDRYGVADNDAYPYITMYLLPFNDRGNHTGEGFEVEFQIDVWYRHPGRGMLQVQKIQARIDELLHLGQPCIDGWAILNLRRTLIDILVEDDNSTLHGLQRFKLLLGEK